MTELNVPIWAWFVLGTVMVVSLLVDLFAHRGNHGQDKKSAVLWSVSWIALSLAFGAWIAVQFGLDAAEDYFTAYLVEKSLSIDNLFIFLLIFSRLRIPRPEQHRVLTWGIIGAFATRALFIASGAALLSAWHGIVYPLGAFLIYTGIKTARDRANTSDEEEGSAKPNAEGEGRILPFIRRHLPFTQQQELDGHHFITIENGRRVGTSLLLALIVVEITDILFAIDSIPAVFAISVEPFIVYSSNIFAILGMRALYLVFADLLSDLKYLRYGLAAILIVAGAKMLTSSVVHVPHVVSLVTVALILAATIVPSIMVKRRRTAATSRRALHSPS